MELFGNNGARVELELPPRGGIVVHVRDHAGAIESMPFVSDNHARNFAKEQAESLNLDNYFVIRAVKV